MPAVFGRSLIGYDLLIAWKGAQAAFAGTRDRLLLLVAAPLLLLLAAQGASNAAAAIAALPVPTIMAVAAIAGLAPNLAIGRRLAHLREHSVVASAALRGGPAAAYALLWNAPPAALALLLGGSGSPLHAAMLLLAYGAGAAAAVAGRRAGAALQSGLARHRAAGGDVRRMRLDAPSRRRRVTDLTASRAGIPHLRFGANIVAFALLGAAAATGCSLLRMQLGEREAAGFAAVAALIIFGLLLHQQAALLRYLLFLGDDPARTATVPVALAASAAIGAIAAAAVAGIEPRTLALAAAATLLLFAAAALLRGLHHAIRPRRAADFAIQIDLAAFLAAGILLPWLAPLLVLGRLFLLHRRAQSLRHIAP